MVIATLVLVFAMPQTSDAAKVKNDLSAAVSTESSATASSSAKDTTLVAAALPSAPAPKAAIAPATPAQPFQPAKPVFTRPRETPTQRKIWYALTIAGSSGAAFDAWSTKRAVEGGYGQESNPMLRPFAHSNVIYAATQVSPAFMDFIGKRLMVSQHPLLRKVWWLPQVAGASFSFAAGAHNVGVVH